MKRIKIKDLKDLPDQMEINLDDGHAITIGRVRRGAPMKCSFPVPRIRSATHPFSRGMWQTHIGHDGRQMAPERHANIVLADD